MPYAVVKKNELMHYGIKGQKKGLRRYQNADGSLTREGMLRYGIGQNNRPRTVDDLINQAREQKKAKVQAQIARTQSTKVPVFNDKSVATKPKVDMVEKNTDSNSKAKYVGYSKDDPDHKHLDELTEKGDFEKYRLGDTEFFGFKGANGKNVIISEDSKWELPDGVELDDNLKKTLEGVVNKLQTDRENGKTWTNEDFIKIVSDSLEKYSQKKSLSHSDELMHYGIFGMRWGVRRYQNEDGSLTAAGHKRYSRQPSPDHYSIPDGKYPYELSDQELKARITRLENEQKYANLADAKLQSRGELAAKKYGGQFASQVAASVVAAAVTVIGAYTWNKLKDKLVKKASAKATGN